LGNLWRLLNIEYTDPYRNMALDEALLIAVERNIVPNTVRFWRNKNAVVIGHSLNVEKEVDVAACTKHDVSIVRRFTGGGAVYQNYGNLNWTIVVRKVDFPKGRIGGLLDIFRLFSKPIVQGLEVLGVAAEFKSPNGVYLYGRKISGMAAYVKRDSILCHGTLLVSGDLRILRDILKNLKADVTTIRDKSSVRPSMKEIKYAIMEGFEITLGINLNQMEISEEEKAITRSLCRKKYHTRQWNQVC
jgi:lipoate-protein ligase A